jgi:Ni,Fe-hydrogenase I cytochrome b subunit
VPYRLLAKRYRNPVAQVAYAGYIMILANLAANFDIFCNLLAQRNVLAQSPQQQLAFIFRQLTVNEGGYLHFQSVVHKSPNGICVLIPN